MNVASAANTFASLGGLGAAGSLAGSAISKYKEKKGKANGSNQGQGAEQKAPSQNNNAPESAAPKRRLDIRV